MVGIIKIKNNTASDGGGLYITYSRYNSISESINGNTATNNGSGNTFGTVSGNIPGNNTNF